MSKLTFKFPGLPDDDGRVSQWHRVEVDYVSGRKLSAYLIEELALQPQQVSHVVIRGKVIAPLTFVDVPVVEPRWKRRLRRLFRRPAPTVRVSAFDAYVPRCDEEIHVVPYVEGKNASAILGVVGTIVVAAVGFYAGGPSGAMFALKAWGFTAFAVGSMAGSVVAALTTPKPKMIKDEDGPSSYIWNGTRNDDRAGVAKPILLGERLVGGKRIGLVRRRENTVPIRTGPSSYDDSSPEIGSEKLEILLLIAGHKCWGPVGVTDRNLPANLATNKPDVRINGSPYTNFSKIEVDWRVGNPGQSVITGFNVVRNTYDLAVDLSTSHATTPYVYTTADEVDAFEVLLTLPAGISHADNEKGIQKNTTRYKLEFRKLGDPTWINADYNPGDSHGACRRLSANVRASRLETRRIAKLADGSPLPVGRYEIRLQWISADHTDADTDTWQIFLTGINEEIQESRNYEGEALLAIRGLATDQLNGPVPTITSVWRGALVEKYTTAGGFSGESFGVGDFAPQGRNVFWQALWLMLNTKIGAGHTIGLSGVDLASFESAAPEADTSEHVVTDTGDEFDEPRHQFDAYIDSDEEAVDLIARMLSTARGVLIFSGNKWRVSVDRPGPITQVFGSGSMQTTGEPPDEEPTFQLQYKSERHEVNCFEATFDDATADWDTESHAEYIDNRDPEDGGGAFATSSDPEADLISLGLPILRRKLQFWGVTRRTQVARECRFALKQAYALRMFGGFVAGAKSLLSEPYDLIGVTNDTPLFSYSGRVMDGCLENLVMLDNVVPFEPDTTYQIRVHFRAPGLDGRDLYETRTVAEAFEPGSDRGVMVTEPFSRVPEEGDEWFYGPTDNLFLPARIVDIDRDADDNRAISFAEFNESIYDTDGPIRIPQYSLLPDVTALPGAIPELNSSFEIIQQLDGRRVTNIINHWARPNPNRNEGPYGGARLEYSFDETHWTTLATVEGTEHRWTEAPHGIEIFFRVIPRSIAGRYNLNGAAYDSVTAEGYSDSAPIVSGITGGYFEGTNFITWASLGPEFEYEVRNANPPNWSTSTTGFLWRGKTTRFDDDSPDARNITYYIRAVDPFGNYSAASNSYPINDAAPAAPTTPVITRYRDGFKIKVVPPAATPDVIASHLHAAQSPSFTPTRDNRVGSHLGAGEGEILFKTTVPGNWYFKATCEDWLSERMNDWVYSVEDDDQIVVVQPVDPGAVTVSTVTRDIGALIDDGSGTGKLMPQTATFVKATWTHNDTTNPSGLLVGYNVLVYDSSEVGTSPLMDSGLIPDVALREYTQRLDEAKGREIVSAVYAVYVDGITSDLITSSGLDIPLETNPIIRDSDDRPTAGYAEDFYDATLPDNFVIDNATYSLSSPAHELKLTKTGTPFRIQWNYLAWARQYLDPAALRSGSATALFRVKFDTPSQLTGPVYIDGHNGAATINPVQVTVPFSTTEISSNVGQYHNLLVPLGAIGTTEPAGTAFIRLNLALSGLPNGANVHITVVSILFETVNTDWDGNVQKGIRARQQFDADPIGGGLYGTSPLRMGDPSGNYTIVEANGITYLRNEAGVLFTEKPYKLGRSGRLKSYYHGVSVYFGATDTMPEPVSYHRTRMLIEDRGNTLLNAAPAAYPVRRWVDVCGFDCEFQSVSLANCYFFGGNAGNYSPSGPWSPTAQAKSAVTLNTSTPTGATRSNDGWYYVQDDGLPGDANDYYYRSITWLAITLPTSKRSNGSHHYVDLRFAVWRSAATLGASQMNLVISPLGANYSKVKVRLFCDGRTYYVPIPVGSITNASDHMARDSSNVLVQWYVQTFESGGSGTVTCEIAKIEWDYIENATNVLTLTAANIGWTWVEEY